MNNICLVVIYNHNYEQNIEAVKRIYSKRFSTIYQLMPFYRGNDPSVIGVYDSSYQFNGYITQAAKKIKGGFSHYVFIADDLMLNPSVDEDNILEILQLTPDSAFHTAMTPMTDYWSSGWNWGAPAVFNLLSRSNACEWQCFMPSTAEARKAFEHHKLDWRKVVNEEQVAQISKYISLNIANPYAFKANFPPDFVESLKRLEGYSEPIYPLARGFSDFFVVPAVAFDDFCHYCGVFAAMRMFVEVAIPTALVLSAARIRTLKAIGLRAENGVANYACRQRLEEAYGFSLARLNANFPRDCLYVHPVKLSKWRDLP